MIIVSDTSLISHLILIDELPILKKVFGTVIIPFSVNEEVLELERFGNDLAEYKKAEWINVQNPSDAALVMELRRKSGYGRIRSNSVSEGNPC